MLKGSTGPKATERKLLDVALAAARDAIAVHRRHLGAVRAEDWSEKGVADFVTFVDHEAEASIVARVGAAFPEHAILAEEQASAAGDGGLAVPREGWVWIIDPLDGTTNFLHRYPMYAVSVAVAHEGELVAGAILSGVTGEEWCAVRGAGAFKDGQRIHVSAIERLPQALIATGFPFKTIRQLPRYLGQFGAVLRSAAGVRRAGSAALDLCHLATGYIDGFWELDLAPWDVAAGTLIVREAGGVITHVDGTPRGIDSGSVLAGNAAIHAALVDCLNGAD